LRDISGGGAPLLGIFEDGTPDDNWANVSFPTVRLRNITVTLDRLVAHDDMDNVSPGDWHVIFNVVNFSGAEAPRYGRRVDGPPFPNPEDTQNVSTGETVSIGRSVSFPSISQSETLVVEVRVIDCDHDLPLASEVSRFGGRLDCNGEEEAYIWFAGDHDFAGPAVIQLAPAAWLRGGSFVSRPVPEFTATITISVAP
jgi:hypothetical protein